MGVCESAGVKHLAKRKYRESTQVFALLFNLCFVWPPTCVDLALTLVELLKFVPKSTQVFHRLAVQRKSTQNDRKLTAHA